jgi:GTP-binding protein HflX
LSPELARHLMDITREIGRQVGVLVERRGHVRAVFVGTADRIYLPDLGRERGGAGQLRGLRHIHTTLGDPTLQPEDLADLTKLRLDAVCALDIETGALELALLAPGTASEVERHSASSVHALDLDFAARVADIQADLARTRPKLRAASDRMPAMVVGVYSDRHMATWRMQEMRELAETAGVEVVAASEQVRPRPDPRYGVGRGKLESVVLTCLDNDVDLILFDHALTPAQARAIAAFSDLKVIDRTQLILDIFSQHAQSRDGKLQVELAQLKYNLPRLTDLDAGLSRLTGGIGGRGPGETKLEINRRRARDRIARLEREIGDLSKQRALRRKQRRQSGLPVVSIVGYTNAGKSTLLNALTQSHVEVADKLFATLDPSSRRLRFPLDREAVITDTVGFIRSLPPDLIRAFSATLEELQEADLLLHVLDAADPMFDEKRAAVETLLADLQLAGIPQLRVVNKSDKVEAWRAAALADKVAGIAVSAVDRATLRPLVAAIEARLWRDAELTMDPTGRRTG